MNNVKEPQLEQLDTLLRNLNAEIQCLSGGASS